MLLEAQKGPESLQEALRVQAGNHRSQQEELRAIISSLRVAAGNGQVPAPPEALGDPRGGEGARALLEALPPQMGQLRRGLGGVQGELAAVRELLENQRGGAGEGVRGGALLGRLQDGQRTLGQQIRTSSAWSAVFSYSAAAATVCALYLLLGGGA